MCRLGEGRSREGGVTLVEAMVVVALMAIMVGLGYSGFEGPLRRQRCQAATQRVGWLLKQAQMKAIEKNTDCSVILDNATDTMTVFLDQDGDLVQDADDILIESVDLGREYEGAHVKTGASFRFGTRGLPKPMMPSDTMQINSSRHPTEVANVTVTNLGRIQVEVPERWKY